MLRCSSMSQRLSSREQAVDFERHDLECPGAAAAASDVHRVLRLRPRNKTSAYERSERSKGALSPISAIPSKLLESKNRSAKTFRCFGFQGLWAATETGI